MVLLEEDGTETVEIRRAVPSLAPSQAQPVRQEHHLLSSRFAFSSLPVIRQLRLQDPPNIPPEAPEHPELEIVGENRPSMHANPMSAGPPPYVSMSPMHPHMHGHPSNMGMPMSMGPNMLDHSGKPTGSHMGVPPVRAPQDRKIRGQAAATTSGGTTKRTPRMPRSATGRGTALQPQAPTAPNVYPTQPGTGAHAVYQTGSYGQWIPSSNMPGGQQPSMMSPYQNNPQMKQAHVMQNVRPTGIPNRPGVAYANQPIQQPPSVQAPMSVNYMPDQSSIMMPSSGVPSAQVNRPGVPPIGKRKLNEANMYGNDQPQYTTPAKMPLQSAGRIDHGMHFRLNSFLLQ